MNFVAQLFSPNEVLLDLEVLDKHALFEVVGRLWQEQHGLPAVEVAANLSAREKLGSTGLGQGVAIPHARMQGLTLAVAAFVRPKLPIEFDAPDGNPVACFFLLLAPELATEQHLHILSKVAEMLSKEQFRSQIALATTADEIHQLFAACEGAMADGNR